MTVEVVTDKPPVRILSDEERRSQTVIAELIESLRSHGVNSLPELKQWMKETIPLAGGKYAPGRKILYHSNGQGIETPYMLCQAPGCTRDSVWANCLCPTCESLVKKYNQRQSIPGVGLHHSSVGAILPSMYASRSRPALRPGR